LEIAPAKVLQGAVRLHGLTSSPTPETQVRVAWAWPSEAIVRIIETKKKARKANRNLFIFIFSMKKATESLWSSGRTSVILESRD
jgi:hypothetical protein